MSFVVVDASVAMRWLVQDDSSPRALGLIGQGSLVAPQLIVAEIANALWRYVAAGLVEAPAAAAAAASLPRYLSRTFALDELAGAALEMAVELGHPAYDCFYLALAEKLDCQTVTADRRFAGRVGTSRWRDRLRVL